MATNNTKLLNGWSLEIAKKWNSGSYSMFVLHGNIFDIFPIYAGDKPAYAPLKAFLSNRLFSERAYLLFFDIGDGLTFATEEMQSNFFKWLEYYDRAEKTNYHVSGLPRSFIQIAPILRRFALAVQDEQSDKKGITIVIDFPEKIVPASDESSLNNEERMSLVTFLKWATGNEMRDSDVNFFLVTESLYELNKDLLNNPYISVTQIDLPNEEVRLEMLNSGWLENLCKDYKKSILPTSNIASLTAGLNLVRIRNMLSEFVLNNEDVTFDSISNTKKKLIEEYCQGLVKFKEPNKNIGLKSVATHTAAKKKLEEIAWLIKNNKRDVLEKGILLPGRVGVGKSFLIDCFASDCGLPVMTIGNFRSKWVGDTESQQAKILMIIKALGPVIVVIDEADAVLGNRENSGDSGVSSRSFAAFAEHIGDASIRGKELWVAMTSRPDLLSIDMKRQGRFGLCIPLFPAQNEYEVIELFSVVSKNCNINISPDTIQYIKEKHGKDSLTGSEVESMVIRAKEIAVLAGRDNNVTTDDFINAIESFIDPLDKRLLEMQEYAAVLACSDARYLPERYKNVNRNTLCKYFNKIAATT